MEIFTINVGTTFHAAAHPERERCLHEYGILIFYNLAEHQIGIIRSGSWDDMEELGFLHRLSLGRPNLEYSIGIMSWNVDQGWIIGGNGNTHVFDTTGYFVIAQAGLMHEDGGWRFWPSARSWLVHVVDV